MMAKQANTHRHPSIGGSPSASRIAALLLAAVALTAGCSTATSRSVAPEQVVAHQAPTELSEDQLLDVWIETFDPGKISDSETEEGLSMEIREAEARFMPTELRSTMERTGYWGAVRTVPQGVEGAEVMVAGKIEKSNGETLSLVITATDARGVQWFSSRYAYKVDFAQYRKRKPGTGELFAPLYNTIANDLARHRAKLSAEQVTEIRRTAQLRFAADLAPSAFSDHIEKGSNGRYALVRLPARDDPMYGRVMQIRERELVLVDTLSSRSDAFYREMRHPYQEWRKARAAEAEALRQVKREAFKQKALGALAIGAAIGLEAAGIHIGSTASSVLVVGGAYAIRRGIDLNSETAIHRDALQELGLSFSRDARPLVVELDGETHELTGNAEAQYARWRELLRRIHRSETGLADSSEVNPDRL